MTLSVCVVAPAASAGEAFKWSVQYLIDTSRTVLGHSQKISPRHNRGLAISPDGKFLYAGYLYSSGGAGEVRRLAIGTADYDLATVAVLPGLAGQAIATDDRGRVYISEKDGVFVYDAALHDRLYALATEACDGLATAREKGELILYTTGRETGRITRWVAQEKQAGIATMEMKGLADDGRFSLPGAVDLRGIKADSHGHLWVADFTGNRVSRITLANLQVASVPVDAPMDLALDSGRVFVTRSRERAITVLDESVHLLGSLAVPWEELALSPTGNNHNGALAGIVALPGHGIFVANEAGQTANHRSTYGRTDEHSDSISGTVYRDAFGDDDEPILHATPMAGH